MVWRRILITGILGAVAFTVIYIWVLRLSWALEPVLTP